MKSSKIAIDRPSVTLSDSFNAATPTIGGFNVFSGDWAPDTMAHGTGRSTIAVDQESWQAIWDAAGETPPGPLPKNAIAVIHCIAHPGVQFDMELKSVTQTDGLLHLDYKATTTRCTYEQTRGAYMIVILPRINGEVKQTIKASPAKPPKPNKGGSDLDF